jgi:hypothetical protein
MRGTVETWGNSQWKYQAEPGQLSVENNIPEYRSTLTLKYLTDVYSRNAFKGDYLQLSFIRKIW